MYRCTDIFGLEESESNESGLKSLTEVLNVADNEEFGEDVLLTTWHVGEIQKRIGW